MKDSHPASGPLGWLWSVRPARWVPEYRSAWLPSDAIAGITLAADAIPVSLAYASRTALFVAAIPVAGVIGNPVSGTGGQLPGRKGKASATPHS